MLLSLSINLNFLCRDLVRLLFGISIRSHRLSLRVRLLALGAPEPLPLPEPGDLEQWVELGPFRVTNAMGKTIRQALEAAMVRGGTDSEGQALEYMAADFLGTPAESYA